MYAFAIWDDRRKKLVLGRDRLGKKPLYYTVIGKTIVFGSEIKSLLQCPQVKKDINLEAIHQFLNYQYIPGPKTIYRDLYSLPPASILACDYQGNIAISRYWDLDYTKKTQYSFSEASEHLKELLTEATKIRMVSDVPLGALLSGGHDSSIVVGLMSKLSDRPVKTFSVGFEGGKRKKNSPS